MERHVEIYNLINGPIEPGNSTVEQATETSEGEDDGEGPGLVDSSTDEEKIKRCRVKQARKMKKRPRRRAGSRFAAAARTTSLLGRKGNAKSPKSRIAAAYRLS